MLQIALLAIAVGGLISGYLLWPRDDSLARVRRSGVVRIGYAIEAPYAFLRADGQVTGESPEVARVVADRLGIATVRWRLVNFESLVDELEAGNIDVIAAGMAITLERERRVAFGTPTIVAAPALLVRRGNPRGLYAAGDFLIRSDIKVAVLSASIEERQLREHGVPAARLMVVPDALTGKRAVETGTADALVLTAPTLHWMTRGETKAAVEVVPLGTGRLLEQMKAAPVFRREDAALRRAWSAELDRFVGTPEHLRLLREFGFEAADLPANGVSKSTR